MQILNEKKKGEMMSNVGHSSNNCKKDQSAIAFDYRSCVIIADDIPKNTDEAALRVHFCEFGEVKEIDFVTDSQARISFARRGDAEQALCNGSKLNSVEMRLKFAFSTPQFRRVNEEK